MRKHSSAICWLLALASVAQVRADDPARVQGGLSPELEAMVEGLSLAPQHQRLARLAGDWTWTAKWLAPGMAGAESTGTMHAETSFDGRYVEQQWIGQFMGKPFELRGTDAYDNVTKRFLATRIELGGGMTMQTGTCDEAMTVCTFSGPYWDTASGNRSEIRSVITWTGEDSFRSEGYGSGPDGLEIKVVEVVATRKKQP